MIRVGLRAMSSKGLNRGLWIATVAVLVVAAVQGLSGHWVTFYLIWPGSATYGHTIIQAMSDLANYHKAAGVAIAILSLLILILAFASKHNLYVRIFALLGFVLMVVTIIGGYKYVTSGFQDRWSLGQMADGFVGVFAAYFVQLLLMVKTPDVLSNLGKARNIPKG
jgi:hypothetical protein